MAHAEAQAIAFSSVEKTLQSLGITLPESVAPAAAYVPFTVSGNTATISGQLPLIDGKPFKTGIVGKDVSLEEAKETAKVCAINVLSHLKKACGGNLDRVKKAIKLEILVAATPDFTDPHLVANGASELILAAFGEEKGKHARVAYGVSTLPLGVAVEVAATFEIE